MQENIERKLHPDCSGFTLMRSRRSKGRRCLLQLSDDLQVFWVICCSGHSETAHSVYHCSLISDSSTKLNTDGVGNLRPSVPLRIALLVAVAAAASHSMTCVTL